MFNTRVKYMWKWGPKLFFEKKKNGQNNRQRDMRCYYIKCVWATVLSKVITILQAIFLCVLFKKYAWMRFCICNNFRDRAHMHKGVAETLHICRWLTCFCHWGGRPPGSALRAASPAGWCSESTPAAGSPDDWFGSAPANRPTWKTSGKRDYL